MDENNYVQRRGSSIIVAKHPHFLPFEIVTLIFDAIYKKAAGRREFASYSKKC